MQATPSRFTRTNQSRTWNTGNGSPDAICFQVDRPGISIVGVGVYGGVGQYDYELELLEDVSKPVYSIFYLYPNYYVNHFQMYLLMLMPRKFPKHFFGDL